MLVLEIFQDDCRVEDARLAINQSRHFEAWTGGGKRAGRQSGTQSLRCLEIEGESLLAQRDLHFLRIGRQRMFVEQHHGNSSLTSTAALAITAGSLFSGSSTSSPPLIAFTVTMPCGSDARTFSRSTFSGCCTPMVTFTNISVLELTLSARSIVSEE